MSKTDLFLQQVSSSLREAWIKDRTFKPVSHKVQLRFLIQKDGKLSNLRMITSSSITTNDALTLKAVQNASPFSCPPSGRVCHLQADFEYDVASDTKHVKCEFRE